MSIVDDGTNNPTFSYPATAMSGWVCESVQGNQGMNNSSSQGQIFYAAITQNGVQPPQPYAVYPVQNCLMPEGVAGNGSTVPGYKPPKVWSGLAAIEDDMTADTSTKCQNHH